MDRNMAWAQHRRGHSLGSGALREKDEDLALFKDMGKRDKPPFLRSEDQLLDHASLSTTQFGGLSHPHSAPPVERRGIGAELLNSDADKTDYDWLMTPPGTPLFPSLDADAPALQHGGLINRSLAAIKTSRQVGTAPRAKSPAPNVPRGNPSPSRRPSTPQKSQIPTKQAINNNNSRPATPTRSSTPSSRASPQPRPSTPTRQPARPVTPLGARPATPTRRSPTPTTNSSINRPSTPTLRRSTSSPTGGSHIRNPSPTRSTATSVTSARGLSPARGPSPARGVSPARGMSPAPSSRGRSPSPSLRAPYPVDASDDIPPNLRTSSDRPSSAQRRAVAYGASPGEGHHPLRRTPSPARSVTSSVTRVERASRGASSDSESSFDTCSQSGVSTYGLVTPERRRMLGRATGVEYGRSGSLTQKTRRSGSSTSPLLAPSASKKSFESAAREYHRGQVAAFRPLMTNSSISTFYSSRASGLLRRPLTPSSTCSSSEHGATVAHDSDEDAGSSSQWKPSTKASSGAHSPLHLFDKSLRDASTLDASCSIVDDNDELSSFFRTPEALQVESMSLPVTSHCKVDELESPEFASELDWLNSRNPHELDREYLQFKDIDGAGASISDQDSKQGSSSLEKIRDKLRHLKSTVAEPNEDAESASRLQQAQSVTRAPTAQDINIVDDEEMQVELLLQGASCEVCGFRKQGCHCSATTLTSQAHEGSSGRLSLTEGSSSSNVESAEKAANMVYAKERDIWYIYRHSSEYEVPVAGFSETKMEIDPPQILAKEVHMKASPTSVSAQQELAREDSSPPTVYIGKSKYASSEGHKENVTMEEISMEVSPCGKCLISEAGNATPASALYGKEVDGGLAAIGAADVERKGLEVGTTTIPSTPYPEGGVVQHLKQAPYQPERASNIPGEQSEKENTQACSFSDKPLHMSSEPHQNAQMPALQYSSSVTHRANTISQSFEAEKRPEPATSQEGGQVEWSDHTADAQASPVNSNSTEEQSHFRPELSSAKEEASEQGLTSACTVEAHWNEDHVSVIPQVKKIIWQEEDLQQFGTRPEAGTVHSRADEHERTCREGDEVELGWGNGKVEDIIFVAGCHPEGSVEPQRPVALTHGPNGVKPKTTRTDDSGPLCFEPLELVGQKYLLTGEVHIDSALFAAAHLSDDSLVIKVQSSDGRVLALDNPARLISEPNDDINSYAVFEYSHWAEVGAQLTFSAHYGREEENSPAEILFYPREHQVHVTTDGKQPRIPKFQGLLGMYAKGSVVPALDGAQITVVTEKDSEAGGLKSGEIAVVSSDGVCVAGPLYDDATYLSQATSAGIHPSRQRNPEPLSNAPDAKATQSKADVPALEGNVDRVQEVQVGDIIPHNGDLPQEVGTYNAVDPRLGVSPDETTPTADHFDNIFECSGSKRDPCSAQPAVQGAEIPNSAIVKPSSFNGVTQSTRGSDRHTKERTPPRWQSRDTNTKCNSRPGSELPVLMSQSRDNTNKCTSRADSELPAVVSQSRGTTTKCTSHLDSELPVMVSKSRDTTTKCTSRADSELSVVASQSRETNTKCDSRLDSELPVVVSQNRDTNTKCTSRADSELPVVLSQSRDNATRCTARADSELPVVVSQSRDNTTRCTSRAGFAPKSKVAVEAPVKEEIVESADSPSPGTTRKHMSSFKFSHKKASPSELKRSNTTFSSSTTAASKLGTQQQSDPVLPGSKKSINNKLPVNGKPASPHLNKGRSVRAASPARPPPSAKAATLAELPGANGEVPSEEASIHSRFSNITVRSGSDTENFDWGPSSLEETSSRCGSSSGANAASMAVLSRSPSKDDKANGDHKEEGQTSPSAQSSVVNPRDSTGAGLDGDGSQSSPSSESTAGSSAMQSHHPTVVVRPHHGPTSVNNNNYAPKQNLDKLSEKLEQLETFGARVLLRNPQQQFLRSPPHGNTKPDSRSWQPAVVIHPKPHHLTSCHSSRSHGTVRLDHHSANPNMCRCTIL